MTTATIRINAINDVKDFATIVSGCPYIVDITSGRYTVDAKSIMGLFSLDLSNDLDIKIHSDDCGDFLDEISRFIVG